MAAELLDPAAKSIYKGKDAFAEYGSGEYWKGVGKAGLTGMAVSGVYGGAFDVMAGGVKAGDINAAKADINATVMKSENLKEKNRFTEDRAKRADSQTLGNLKIIEYNWGIKKDVSLDGVGRGNTNRISHDVSSDTSLYTSLGGVRDDLTNRKSYDASSDVFDNSISENTAIVKLKNKNVSKNNTAKKVNALTILSAETISLRVLTVRMKNLTVLANFPLTNLLFKVRVADCLLNPSILFLHDILVV